jgi:hypothetical protein
MNSLFEFFDLLIIHLETALTGFAFEIWLFDEVEHPLPEFVIETLIGVDEEFVEL